MRWNRTADTGDGRESHGVAVSELHLVLPPTLHNLHLNACWARWTVIPMVVVVVASDGWLVLVLVMLIVDVRR